MHFFLLLLVVSSGFADDFYRMNAQLKEANAFASLFAWKEAVEPDAVTIEDHLQLVEARTRWRNLWCHRLEKEMDGFLDDQLRQYYLLCRGPKYDPKQARDLAFIVTQLRKTYQTSRACGLDLERLMTTSRDYETLLSAWIKRRNAIGGNARELYSKLVELLNAGARNNGYNDIGECWREELEVDHLEGLVDELYEEVRPLYEALHAVVRHRLARFYGVENVALDESIPAHLLGDMWAQNWSSLLNLILDVPAAQDVAVNLKRKNYTVTDLVKRAEDFYMSIGFEAMTEAFWKNSRIENGRNDTVCHASAANMFRPGDFRMLLCAEVTTDDFYVIHHEMGHIEYFMKYRNQPAIFQGGTNSAFHEAIGDAILYGVMTPTHLHRLGLIQEVEESSGIDIRILLQQALSRLPEIPFALALEKWRWGVFRGEITQENYNQAWWVLREKYQGLRLPIPRSEEHFDPASKFHIIENTPYIRYFLGSILQVQIFESLCKESIFGYNRINKTLPVPLHRCDIYGSREATKKLREMMSLGSKIHWSDALRMVTGKSKYSTKPLLAYYKLLYDWLMKEIRRNDIPVGW